MIRKLLILVIAILLIAGCSSKSSDNSKTTAKVKSKNAENNNAKKKTADVKSEDDKKIVEPKPIKFNHKSKQKIEPGKMIKSEIIKKEINLEKGISIFQINRKGIKNLIGDTFMVELLDSSGLSVDATVATINDNYNGSKVVGIEESGKYTLKVTSFGDWQISITQPRNVEAKDVPINLKGKGPQHSDFIKLKKGTVELDAKHTGKSNFIVKLYKEGGEVIKDDFSYDRLVNVIGDADKSTKVDIDKTGVYILNIEADGPWTISVK